MTGKAPSPSPAYNNPVFGNGKGGEVISEGPNGSARSKRDGGGREGPPVSSMRTTWGLEKLVNPLDFEYVVA